METIPQLAIDLANAVTALINSLDPQLVANVLEAASNLAATSM